MERPRQSDPFSREMWQDRLYAVTSSWKAILLITCLGVLSFVLGLSVTNRSKQPTEEEVGQVIRFGSYATDEGDRPLVLVKLRDGTRRQLFIRRAQLQTCRVHAPLRLVRRGDWLAVHHRGCPAGLTASQRPLSTFGVR